MGIAIAYTLLFSYPALFMLNRGNFAAGLNCLGVVAYVLTYAQDRYRVLGWLSLAVAVNLRPFSALFCAIELSRGGSLAEKLWGPIVAGGFSIGLALASLSCLRIVYPDYSPADLFGGYGAYVDTYVIGDMGLAWNSSLFGATKAIRALFDIHPYYDKNLFLAVSVLSVMEFALLVLAALRRRLTILQATFALTSFYVLYTPVSGLYYTLLFAAPLLMTLLVCDEDERNTFQWHVMVVSSLLMMCPLGDALMNGTIQSIGCFLAVNAVLLTALCRRVSAHLSKATSNASNSIGAAPPGTLAVHRAPPIPLQRELHEECGATGAAYPESLPLIQTTSRAIRCVHLQSNQGI